MEREKQQETKAQLASNCKQSSTISFSFSSLLISPDAAHGPAEGLRALPGAAIPRITPAPLVAHHYRIPVVQKAHRGDSKLADFRAFAHRSPGRGAGVVESQLAERRARQEARPAAITAAATAAAVVVPEGCRRGCSGGVVGAKSGQFGQGSGTGGWPQEGDGSDPHRLPQLQVVVVHVFGLPFQVARFEVEQARIVLHPTAERYQTSRVDGAAAHFVLAEFAPCLLPIARLHDVFS